ncbi:uncharacterized protein DUF2851 [Dokdonia sp. Hel_I_63]|uniref:DUF2851 family protein n=1 Tax=Dokdonia sp. Hel_I_63 TaxID=1249996 RepID=UPI0011991D41|nr:DUF2851 family protein [Dokdonia sp. Hel_I_63]TVZ22672.1 uncharacterized protein DUF2851 [Dokdonia sp. Hel_I_63]
MQEDFLHYLWKFKKYAFAKAETTTGLPITLIKVGQHNHLAGPDFFNTTLVIGGQKWAGNVEIHLKSSDWYAHNHEVDAAYDNVILHVVWEHDVEIYRKDNSAIPTLVLKDLVAEKALRSYKELFNNQSQQWINCENSIREIPQMIQSNWLERLYFERLTRKTEGITPMLNKVNGDWEAALFVLLMRSFGTKVNANAFQSIAEKLDFSTIRKCAQEPFRLEALLLGIGGLLPENTIDSYPMQLQGEYEFVSHKFQIASDGILPVQFYKLRPDNFPTIRLSQVAQLYHKHLNLFQKMMSASTIAELYALLDVKASQYWDTHYSFGKDQKKRAKKLSSSFIDIIIINAIIPLRFSYNQYLGKDESEVLLSMMHAIKPECNSIIKKYNTLRDRAQNAQETQALLELKANYCDLNKCLSCAVGNYLIKH